MTASTIHKFKFGDLNIVLDVNSGALHVVSELGGLVIDLVDKGYKEGEIQEILTQSHDSREITKVYQEVEELNEKELLFSQDYTQSYSRSPEHIVKALCFHMAHDCNMTCSYCFAEKGAFGGTKSLMTREVAFKGIDFLIQSSGSRKNCEVDFFGGEPLLNFPLIRETVDYARNKGKESGKEFSFTLTTNGVLLDMEAMDYLDQEDFSVVLSLDGRREINDRVRTLKGKGTYDGLVPKYLSFVEKREHKGYYIRGTYTRYNLDFSEDLKHLAELGFKSISLEPVVASPELPYALQEEDLPAIYRQYEKIAELYQEYSGTLKSFSFFHFNLDLSQGPCIKKRLSGCGAGTEYLALTPEGDLYPCHQFAGINNFLMGNVLKGLCYDPSLYDKFLKVDINSKDECRHCWAKFFCGGGCHANAYNFNRDLYRPYSMGCHLEKKRLECALGLQAYRRLDREL